MASATKRSPLRNFHLPLPDDTHRELRAEAERAGRPATALVRDAVEAWLAARRRAALHHEIAAYAQHWAGSEVDLDESLERASVDQLRGSRKRR